jgi:hypothetical protein
MARLEIGDLVRLETGVRGHVVGHFSDLSGKPFYVIQRGIGFDVYAQCSPIVLEESD